MLNVHGGTGRRLVAATVVAACLLVPSAADAVPDMGQGETVVLTVYLPDPSNALAICRHDFTPVSSVTFTSPGIGVGVAHQSGTSTARTTGCTNSWTVTVTIVSKTTAGGGTSPAVTGAAGPANPASRRVGQDVPHATTGRLTSLVEFTLAATSAKASFCHRDVWQVSAFGNPSPVSSGPC